MGNLATDNKKWRSVTLKQFSSSYKQFSQKSGTNEHARTYLAETNIVVSSNRGSGLSGDYKQRFEFSVGV